VRVGRKSLMLVLVAIMLLLVITSLISVVLALREQENVIIIPYRGAYMYGVLVSSVKYTPPVKGYTVYEAKTNMGDVLVALPLNILLDEPVPFQAYVIPEIPYRLRLENYTYGLYGINRVYIAVYWSVGNIMYPFFKPILPFVSERGE